MPASFSDYTIKKILDHIFGATSYTPPTNLYAALFTVAPLNDGTGGTEVSGGSYARVTVANNTTNFPNATGAWPNQIVKKNGTLIQFPTATANWGTVVAMGFYDASSGGNLICWGPLLGTPYTFTALALTDVFTAPGSSFANTNEVRLADTVGYVIPGGFNTTTTYFVRDASGNTFKLAATSGGAAIDVTSDGSGRIALLTSKNISSGDTASFAVNSFQIYLL